MPKGQYSLEEQHRSKGFKGFVGHAVCVLETAKGAQGSSADAAVMVLAGLFKTQAGTPPISPKALKVSRCDASSVGETGALP
jgi:hypothetical protein